MDVIFFMVPLLDSEFWVVVCYLVRLVLEVGPEAFVNHFSSVLGADDNMVVTEVNGVGIVDIVHTCHCIRRGRGVGERLHPTSLRSGI